MTYFVIDSFGKGLDARRHILNMPPGALYLAQNVNINRGGEPETAKAFVPAYSFPPGQTFGLMAAGSKLYTFGSVAPPAMPAGITYQQLVHPTGGAMTAFIWGTPVKGKPFVIASFVTGYGVFFNGAFITDWQVITTGIGNYTALAANLATQIQNSAIYSATSAANVVTVTGRPATPFAISASAVNGGTVDDQTAVASTTQNSTSSGPGTVATGSFTFSGVAPVWDSFHNVYVNPPTCSTVTVGGVDLMRNTTVSAPDNASAAQDVANIINSFSGQPYSASVSGPTVNLTATNIGAAPNGQTIVVNGGFALGPWPAIAGGQDSTAGQAQISTVTLGGTYEGGDSFAITLNGVVYTIAVDTVTADTPAGGQRPTCALTKNSKTYAIAGPNLFGSMIGDCTKWNAGTGSFVTDMSSEIAGAEILIAMGVFQGNLAIFSRSTIQIEFVDPDPSNNEQLQVMQNIGTMAAKTVVPFGDIDLFFLSDTGLRSLKVRLATDSATVADIGSPIDPLIIAAIKAQGDAIQFACAAMEPVDGRFLLQIGTTTYVFSSFPDAKVGGWTTYETGLQFTDFAVLETKLFARAGDTGYVLGGPNNDQYTDQIPNVKLPFMSARQVATLKHFTAFDVVCDGTFDISIATDPLNPDEEEIIATTAGSTLGLGISPFQGEDVTAVSLRFVGRAGQYGRVSAVAMHYDPIGENA